MSRRGSRTREFGAITWTAIALKLLGALTWSWPHLIGWLAILLMMMVALEEIGSYARAIARRHMPSLARRLHW